MFPGISVAYTDYEEACLTLDGELEVCKAPRAVFEISGSSHRFLDVCKVTENEDDEGMLLTARLNLKIESMVLLEDGSYFF